MMDQLVAWLRKRTGMAIQAAAAMTNAVGNLRSQFSPQQLYALHTAQYALLNHLLERGDEQGIKLLAEGYQLHSGYNEAWRPQADADAPTIEQWAERACLHAHETGSRVIVVEANHGGDLAASVLAAAWSSLVATGKLPPDAEVPLIEQTVATAAADDRT